MGIRSRIVSVLLLSIFLVSALSGCTFGHGVATDVQVRQTWIIPDPEAVLASLPPVSPPSDVPEADAAIQARFRQPVIAWINVELDAIQHEVIAAPRAGRALAYVALALNDTVQVTDVARHQGQHVSDAAALGAVAEQIIGYFHPLRAGIVTQEAAQARWVDVWLQQADAPAVMRGTEIGEAVAAQVLAHAQADGADQITARFDEPRPATGRWQRTPPAFAAPLEPHWGAVTTFAVANGQAMRATPPPAWDDPAFVTERAAFATTQAHLTDADRQLAEQWNGGVGTVTPGGLWVEIARGYILRDQLDNRAAARVFAAVGVALHDGFVACWESKYYYLVARPVQWMREQPHQDNWLPTVTTPPFPSYPSGHATISGAASTVLAGFFPQDAAHIAQQAEAAARSRVVGGIHWSLDGAGGLAQGRAVGKIVLEHAGVER